MFSFKKVTTGEELQEVYRLRYKVYCDEWGFERPEDHPEGIEQDEYDEHSTHFVAFRNDTGQFIGTVRLIFDSELGFPLERHCEVTKDLSGIDRSRLAEISRLAVSKEYRKRLVDRIIFNEEEYREPLDCPPPQQRRVNDYAIVLGLYRCIYRESMERGITHLYAAMADGLYFLLRRNALLFEPIGPTVEYHGRRTPYICTLEKTIAIFARKNPSLYQHFMSLAA